MRGLAGCDRGPVTRHPPELAAHHSADELEATGCPPLPPISGFVGRDDGALLFDRITPYRATGTNLYYLQQLLSYAQQDQDATALRTVEEILDDLVCLSLPVARIWGFNDSPNDTSAIRHNPQEGFREADCAGWTRRCSRPSAAASASSSRWSTTGASMAACPRTPPGRRRRRAFRWRTTISSPAHQ